MITKESSLEPICCFIEEYGFDGFDNVFSQKLSNFPIFACRLVFFVLA